MGFVFGVWGIDVDMLVGWVVVCLVVGIGILLWGWCVWFVYDVVVILWEDV